VETYFDPALEGAIGSESLLRHIFSNLLSNAAKYSPPGSPVEFTVKRDGADAVFTIRDRGIGIPESDQPRIFDAFHRAGNVGELPGSGLGLLITKRCVELHGGSIGFHSEAGSGTTFSVRLPVFG
jgi:signal transduction histidine kinase